MIKFIVLAYMLMLSISFIAFGQQVGEITLSFGISKTSPAVQSQLWDEPIPAYLKMNVTKSWYSNNHKVSLRKEVGINMQNAKISLTSAGLGVYGYLSGNIISLFADAALMPNVQITNSLAFCIGPEAEFLVIGKNHLKDYYSYHYSNPPYSGEILINKINRDYFQEPSYGIRMRLYKSGLTDRISIGIGASYLWTKRLYSNFYAENYKRISIFIGFKNKKKEIFANPKN